MGVEPTRVPGSPEGVGEGDLPAPCGPSGLPGQRCLPGAGSGRSLTRAQPSPTSGLSWGNDSEPPQ